MLRRNFLIKETRKQCLRKYVGRNSLVECLEIYSLSDQCPMLRGFFSVRREIKIFCKEMYFCKNIVKPKDFHANK